MEYTECLYIGRLNIVKISILPKLTYRFNTAPIKIIAGVFADIHKIILKFMWKDKGTRIAKNNFEKKDKVARTSLPNFKSYNIVRVIKTGIGGEFPGSPEVRTLHFHC